MVEYRWYANRYIENATVVNYGSYGLGITNADNSLPSGADVGEGLRPSTPSTTMVAMTRCCWISEPATSSG